MIEEKPLPWQELLEVLFRRRRIIFGAALVGFTLSATSSTLQPERFRAMTRLQISEEAISAPREEGGSKQQIATEVNLLQSPSLTRRVLEDYRKTQQPMEPNRTLSARVRRGVKEFVDIDVGVTTKGFSHIW